MCHATTVAHPTHFFLTGKPDADALLAADPNAVLLGMLLDQQVPMEKAFSGPVVIAERMGGTLDVAAITATDPGQFAALCAKPPAVHRFPGSMAVRLQAVCAELVQSWDGSAAQMYASAQTGAELVKLIQALPGFGEQKAKILVALLGKRFGVQPNGWAEAAGPYGVADSHVSVADVVDLSSLQLVRAAKKRAKAVRKAGPEQE